MYFMLKSRFGIRKIDFIESARAELDRVYFATSTAKELEDLHNQVRELESRIKELESLEEHRIFEKTDKALFSEISKQGKHLNQERVTELADMTNKAICKIQLITTGAI